MLKLLKSHNANVNNRVRYKYHKSNYPQVGISSYIEKGRHVPKAHSDKTIAELYASMNPSNTVQVEESEDEDCIIEDLQEIEDEPEEGDEACDSDDLLEIEEKDLIKRRKETARQKTSLANQARLQPLGPSTLIESDIKNITVQAMYRMWIAQLMENAIIEENATNIEVRFYRMGLNGFDIIYDGDGISDKDIQDLCLCMKERERNEIYKTRSLGYRGEAMNSLAKSSTLTVLTRNSLEDNAWKISYKWDCSIANIEISHRIQNTGTIIEVRNIHNNNKHHRSIFEKTLEISFASIHALLSSYSYIFTTRSLKVTHSLKWEDANRGTVVPKWETHPLRDLHSNVQQVLDNQNKAMYVNMSSSLYEWQKTFVEGQIHIKCCIIRPGSQPPTPLVRKCLHIFLNERPVVATHRFIAVFQDLYKDFGVPPHTIPFVVVSISAHEDSYDIKLRGDIRKFFFKPQYEKMMYERLRTELLGLFNKLASDKTFREKYHRSRALPMFKQKKEEMRFTIDKKTLRLPKSEMAHLALFDNISDDSVDEMVKEQEFEEFQVKGDLSEFKFKAPPKEEQEIKQNFFESSYKLYENNSKPLTRLDEKRSRSEAVRNQEIKVGQMLGKFDLLKKQKEESSKEEIILEVENEEEPLEFAKVTKITPSKTSKRKRNPRSSNESRPNPSEQKPQSKAELQEKLKNLETTVQVVEIETGSASDEGFERQLDYDLEKEKVPLADYDEGEGAQGTPELYAQSKTDQQANATTEPIQVTAQEAEAREAALVEELAEAECEKDNLGSSTDNLIQEQTEEDNELDFGAIDLEDMTGLPVPPSAPPTGDKDQTQEGEDQESEKQQIAETDEDLFSTNEYALGNEQRYFDDYIHKGHDHGPGHVHGHERHPQDQSPPQEGAQPSFPPEQFEPTQLNVTNQDLFDMNELQPAEDLPENMLNFTEGEEMFTKEEDFREKPKSINYSDFDMEMISNTYLGPVTKSDVTAPKYEPLMNDRLKGESSVKGEKGQINFQVRSFFERLGPEYQHVTLQARSRFFDKYMASVNNRKLKRVFLKSEFYRLQVVGQFNKGFMLASMNSGRDLFILDQHACHERYNLEKFNTELRIDSQIIIKPKFLTIDAEIAPLLSKYQEVFEFNGLKYRLPDDFEKLIKREKPVKVQLLSLPQSLDLQFDESDFFDLLTAIRNYDNSCKKAGHDLLPKEEIIGALRPRKVHGILAMKACRNAIFIGKVMTKKMMRSLIDKLRYLKRPWICAHGRPTMRYLMNIDNLKSEFATPSKIYSKANSYCALTRRFRQRPPALLKRIGHRERIQLDDNYFIYPSEELIELKRQFLIDKQKQVLIDQVKKPAEKIRFTIESSKKKKVPAKDSGVLNVENGDPSPEEKEDPLEKDKANQMSSLQEQNPLEASQAPSSASSDLQLIQGTSESQSDPPQPEPASNENISGNGEKVESQGEENALSKLSSEEKKSKEQTRKDTKTAKAMFRTIEPASKKKLPKKRGIKKVDKGQPLILMAAGIKIQKTEQKAAGSKLPSKSPETKEKTNIEQTAEGSKPSSKPSSPGKIITSIPAKKRTTKKKQAGIQIKIKTHPQIPSEKNSRADESEAAKPVTLTSSSTTPVKESLEEDDSSIEFLSQPS